MDFGPVTNWTLNEYCCESAGLMDVKRFDARAADDKNILIYDPSRSERYTDLGAWKTRWAVLSRWCEGSLVNKRFADMLYAWCEQRLTNCRWLRDAIDANMKMAGEDPPLQCWFFNKPYTKMYAMCGGTHQTML